MNKIDSVDIWDLRLDRDIHIIGPLNTNNTNILQNIIFILKKKNYKVKISTTRSRYNNCQWYVCKANDHKWRPFKSFNIIVWYKNELPLCHNIKSDITFVSVIATSHVHYLYQKYYGKVFDDNMCSYHDDTSKYNDTITFIVMQNGFPMKICNAEHEGTFLSYSLKAAWCYDKILKVQNNLKKGYSMYDIVNNPIYTQLCIKQTTLDHMYYICWCLSFNIISQNDIKNIILRVLISSLIT